MAASRISSSSGSRHARRSPDILTMFARAAMRRLNRSTSWRGYANCRVNRGRSRTWAISVSCGREVMTSNSPRSQPATTWREGLWALKRQISKRSSQAGRRAPRRFALTSALARVISVSMTACGTAFVRILILRSKRSKSPRHCDSGYTLIKTPDFCFSRIRRSGLRTPFSKTARKLSGIGWLLCKARTGDILARRPFLSQAGSGRFSQDPTSARMTGMSGNHEAKVRLP